MKRLKFIFTLTIMTATYFNCLGQVKEGITNSVNKTTLLSNEKIKRDLLGITLCKSKDNCWSFDALLEFKDVRVEKEIKSENIMEKVLAMELQGIKTTSQKYFMRLYVRYNQDNKLNWVLTKYDLIDYYPI